MSNQLETQEKLETQPTSESDQDEVLTLRQQISTHFSNSVDPSAGYLPLLVCCFVTGLTDGTLYNGMSMDCKLQG
jgi:hypothetical protein